MEYQILFKRIVFATSLFCVMASAPFVSAESQSNTKANPDLNTSVQPQVVSMVESGQYYLGTGDRVKVTVFGHPDLSGEFQLDCNGRISLPLIKEVQSTGLSVIELKTSITEKLSPDYLINPKVSVEVLNYRPFYIIGEVKKPGQFPYVSGMTVLTAVALAGGYTYRAKTDKALITPPQSLNAGKAVAEKVEGGRHTLIKPGEVIEIPEKY